jgi:tRNA pseudouridine38-40 synthase
MRLALGICYSGTAYQGWQSQSTGLTIQDKLEKALSKFADVPRISTLCAGRTDAGVHGLMQVVHFDTELDRDTHSWVRGTNRYLPSDIAVQWAQVMPESFHCRASATGRRYIYVVLDSAVRAQPRKRPCGLGVPPLGRGKHARSQPAFAGRTRFFIFQGQQLPSPVAHQNPAAHPNHPARCLLAL